METFEVIDLNERFYRIRNEILDLKLTTQELAVYNCLSRFSNNTSKKSFPSYNRIMEMVQIGKASIFRSLEGLVKRGLIAIKSDGRGKKNVYYLLKINCSAPEPVLQRNSTGSPAEQFDSQTGSPAEHINTNIINTKNINTKTPAEAGGSQIIKEKSDYQKILDFYYHLFKNKFDRNPVITAPECVAVKNMLKHYSFEEIGRSLEGYFGSDDNFFLKQGYSLKYFQTIIQGIINGSLNPRTDKDIVEDWVKKMKAKGIE